MTSKQFNTASAQLRAKLTSGQLTREQYELQFKALLDKVGEDARNARLKREAKANK